MAIKLDPIVMDRRTAKRHAEAYDSTVNKSKALITQSNAAINDRALAAIDNGMRETYLALGQGKKVIDIRQVFRDAGQDTNLRPNLAIARADWRGVGLRRLMDGSLRFSDPSVTDQRNTYNDPPKVYNFAPGTLPVMPNKDFVAGAMVPTIPPGKRPDKLDDFVLIWEVFDWRGIPTPVPSRFAVFREKFAEKMQDLSDSVVLDPILLRPLGGPLYAVIAAWDLSPLEATIIGAL